MYIGIFQTKVALFGAVIEWMHMGITSAVHNTSTMLKWRAWTITQYALQIFFEPCSIWDPHAA